LDFKVVDEMIANAMHKLRGLAFWSLDALKGRTVKKAYTELKTFDATDSRSARFTEHQKSILQKLLQHAINTTKFYKKIQSNCLSDFPIIDKNIIKNQQDDFMSNKYDRTKLFTMTTSGSTGVKLTCYQNDEKKKRVHAEVIYYSGKAGYLVGEKLIYLRAISEESYKSKLRQWIQNETLLDICNLDDKRIEDILSDIDKASRWGSMILAYASTFEAFKDYFQRKGMSKVGKNKVYGIISSSEMLFDDTRNIISNAFHCRCFSRYSNQENGIIGQDDIEDNAFIINEVHYIVEVFKMNSDILAEEGEVGRLVITDLYNYAMPMIRYDTGDIGSIVYIQRNGVTKKAITNFGGRRVDMVFDCYGNRLSPHIITVNFWQFPEIQQYQFIQESKINYTLKINTQDRFVRQKEMEALLEKLLGDKAVIKIEEVEEIPVLASGKRKYIVNNMCHNDNN
jgi:phenylacetate-CoA ligase